MPVEEDGVRGRIELELEFRFGAEDCCVAQIARQTFAESAPRADCFCVR